MLCTYCMYMRLHAYIHTVYVLYINFMYVCIYACVGTALGREACGIDFFSVVFSGCMIGNHGYQVILDAYVKGIRAFDSQTALLAMLQEVSSSCCSGRD